MRSILSHKLRLALTALAVVLGVAFASGMLMLTNALNNTFLDIFEASAQDVVVAPEAAFEVDITMDVGDRAPLLLDESMVEQVRALPGVAAAAGTVGQAGAYLIDADGDVVGGQGPPALGVDWTADPALNPGQIVTGHAPEAEYDVVVDEVTFGRLGGIGLDEPIQVLTPSGPVDATLVGTFKFGETGGLAGATVAAFRPDTAQRLFAEPGKWHTISVATADGFTDDEVASSISAAIGDGYSVQTRDEQVEAGADALSQGLGFLNYILLGFAGIALFVAAFLIYNTFSMLIAARGREMALLRAVGATRRQVLGAIVFEACVLGLLAAAVGVALGWGLALALKAGVGALGLDLTSGVSPTMSSLVVAVVLGLSVTVVSALAPAVRASRIRPIEALRQASTPPEQPGRVMTALGVVVLAGAAFLVVPAFVADEPDIGSVALGALLLLVAGILLAPVLAIGFALLVSPVLGRIGGVSGRIAGRNASRSPRRAAATASALIVGLALVSGITVIVASAQRSIEVLVDSSFGAELVVTTPANQPFSTVIGDEIEGIDGVSSVMRQSLGPAQFDGDTTTVTALGGAPIESVFTLTVDSGDVADFGPGAALIGGGFAEQEGLAVGDVMALTFPSGQQRDFTVAAVYEASALLYGTVIPLDDYRAVGGAAQDTVLMVNLDDGADPAVVVPQIEEAAAANPLVQVYDQTAIKEQNTAVLNQLLYIIYTMLALSVIIAALGVVNTMVLSVVERTREIGMLRAVGSGRRQVRRMIRWEAVIMSLLGGLAGVGLGLLAGVALQKALAQEGIAELVIPTGTVATLLIAALIIGVLGATFPARRAARMNILESIATE